MSKELLDPYEAFHLWMRENGYEDVADAKPEEVDLERLNEAVEVYGAE